MTTAMAGPGPAAPHPDGETLADPELRRFLREYVKKRVPQGDVDDVVQTVLVDALAASRRPDDRAEMRKWLVGIARHKCADLHRRAGRERPPEDELPDVATEAPPLEERALVRWAEEQARSTHEADRTLGWMAREGEGDKLEHIAEEEQLPPARVRQRVSRMRRLLKERWIAELALVAALGALCLVLWRWLQRPEEGPIVADPSPAPSATPLDAPLPRVAEGRLLRERALETCLQDDHQRCLQQLDEARELDPEGDRAPAVGAARDRAAAALQEVERTSKTPRLSPSVDPGPEPSAPEQKSSPVPPSVPTGNPPKAPPKPQPKAPPRTKEAPFGKESALDSDPPSSPANEDTKAATRRATAPSKSEKPTSEPPPSEPEQNKQRKK